MEAGTDVTHWPELANGTYRSTEDVRAPGALGEAELPRRPDRRPKAAVDGGTDDPARRIGEAPAILRLLDPVRPFLEACFGGPLWPAAGAQLVLRVRESPPGGQPAEVASAGAGEAVAECSYQERDIPFRGWHGVQKCDISVRVESVKIRVGQA